MIRNIAVIGAGAVGSFFLKGWKDWQDGQVWVVARGDRKERLEQEGIAVNGERIPIRVRTPEDSKGADLIIVCVKYRALPEAVQMIEQIADSHTIILCPMNGVDTEEIIAERTGREHVLHSLMYIAAERVGNQISFHGEVNPCINYGRAEGYGNPDDPDDPDLEDVRQLFERTGINSRYQEKIIPAMWKKYVLNVSTNIAQAIVGCSYGSYKISPHLYRMGQLLCDEVMAVAREKGVDIEFDFQETLRTVGTFGSARFSTLQDLMAKRETEVDMFCGVIMRMGKELGVPTPYNEYAYLTIKALEEKNAGIIS